MTTRSERITTLLIQQIDAHPEICQCESNYHMPYQPGMGMPFDQEFCHGLLATDRAGFAAAHDMFSNLPDGDSYGWVRLGLVQEISRTMPEFAHLGYRGGRYQTGLSGDMECGLWPKQVRRGTLLLAGLATGVPTLRRGDGGESESVLYLPLNLFGGTK